MNAVEQYPRIESAGMGNARPQPTAAAPWAGCAPISSLPGCRRRRPCCSPIWSCAPALRSSNGASSMPSGWCLTASCSLRESKGIGACWAVIAEKYRFILFGTYPYASQWRPAVAIALFVFLYLISAWPRLWRKELALVWLVTLVAIGILMRGGVAGLTCPTRPLGRPCHHPHPRNLRPGPGLSPRDPGCARAAIEPARD